MESSQDILKKINIVDIISSYLKLQKKGSNYWALCPFHEDNNPSFSVSFSKQFSKCFVCGEKANAIEFIMKFKKVSFVEALKILKEKHHIDIEIHEKAEDEKSKNLKKDLKKFATFFNYLLKTTENETIKNYLTKRKLESDVINHFTIGYVPEAEILLEYAKSENISESNIIELGLIKLFNNNWSCPFTNRLVFPVCNLQNQVVGFSGRSIEGIENNVSSKYINSSENEIFKKSEILYNFAFAREHIEKKQEIIICEGFMDVIALYKQRIFNCVALMGTNLNNNWTQNFKKNWKIILSLDNDEAGKNITIKLLNLFASAKFNVYISQPDVCKDWDEYYQNNNQPFSFFIKNPIEWYMNIFKNKIDLKNSSSIELFLKNIAAFLNNLKDEIQKNIYLNELKSYLKLDIEIIQKYLVNEEDNNHFAENSFPSNREIKPDKKLSAFDLNILEKSLKNKNFCINFYDFINYFSNSYLIFILKKLYELHQDEHEITVENLKNKVGQEIYEKVFHKILTNQKTCNFSQNIFNEYLQQILKNYFFLQRKNILNEMQKVAEEKQKLQLRQKLLKLEKEQNLLFEQRFSK